jgi:hypothetical protein
LHVCIAIGKEKAGNLCAALPLAVPVSGWLLTQLKTSETEEKRHSPLASECLQNDMLVKRAATLLRLGHKSKNVELVAVLEIKYQFHIVLFRIERTTSTKQPTINPSSATKYGSLYRTGFIQDAAITLVQHIDRRSFCSHDSVCQEICFFSWVKLHRSNWRSYWLYGLQFTKCYVKVVFAWFIDWFVSMKYGGQISLKKQKSNEPTKPIWLFMTPLFSLTMET